MKPQSLAGTALDFTELSEGHSTNFAILAANSITLDYETPPTLHTKVINILELKHLLQESISKLFLSG